MSPRHGGDHGSHLSALRGTRCAQANRGGLRAHRRQRRAVAGSAHSPTTTGLLALADWLERFGVETSRWRRPACTGSRCGACSNAASSWWSPTPPTSIGIDRSRFATPGHLLSWAYLCPRNDESAGQRRGTRLRPGANGLKSMLVQADWAAVKVKRSNLQAQFQRLRAPRGQEGDHRRGRLDAHRHLAHAA